MPETRKCAGCGCIRDRSEMRCAAQGKRTIHLCLGCEAPAGKSCIICGQPRARSVGLCHTHGERWRRWGKPPIGEWVADFLAGRLNSCEICGAKWNGYHGARYCANCGGPTGERRRRDALDRWRQLSDDEKRAAREATLARGRAKRRAKFVERWCVICGDSLGVVSPVRALCKKYGCKRAYTQAKVDACRARAAAADLHSVIGELQRRLDQ